MIAAFKNIVDEIKTYDEIQSKILLITALRRIERKRGAI